MEFAGIAVAVGVVVGAIWLAVRIRKSGDVQSVRGYHRHLDTLGHLGADRESPGLLDGAQDHESDSTAPPSGGGTPREFASDPGARLRIRSDSEGPLPGVSPIPTSITPHRRLQDRSVDLVFDDSAGAHELLTPATHAGARQRALSSMNRRSRQMTLPAGIVAAAAVIAAIIVLADHGGSPTSNRHAAGASGGSQGRSAPASLGTPDRHPTSQAGGRHSAGSASATTLPKVNTAVMWTPWTATYVASSASYQITVSATTASCWVSATSGGTTLFTGILDPGVSTSLTAQGVVTVVVGAPIVATLTIDGTPVVLPTGFQTPFTVTIRPPSAS